MKFGCVLRLDTNGITEKAVDFHEKFLNEDEECLKLNRKKNLKK